MTIDKLFTILQNIGDRYRNNEITWKEAEVEINVILHYYNEMNKLTKFCDEFQKKQKEEDI
jgi:hypothetical protein